MVSFTPTEEQQLLIDTIRRYATQDVRKIAHEADEASEPALAVIETGWQMGLIPSAIPEEMGGFAGIKDRFTADQWKEQSEEIYKNFKTKASKFLIKLRYEYY